MRPTELTSCQPVDFKSTCRVAELGCQVTNVLSVHRQLILLSTRRQGAQPLSRLFQLTKSAAWLAPGGARRPVEGQLVAAEASAEASHPKEVNHLLIVRIAVVGAQPPQLEALLQEQELEEIDELRQSRRHHAGRDVHLNH